MVIWSRNGFKIVAINYKEIEDFIERTDVFLF